MTAKTDRELLELAAKAAGLPLCSEWDAATDGILIGRGNGDLQPWNPLTSDGDALRLAVKLSLMVDSDSKSAESQAISTSMSENVPHGDDPYAATRRAIVRAAAAIGETL